jgi:uncharacterized protein YcgI (DUF1989 family)
LQLINRIIVPPRAGKAFEVRHGQLLRVVLPEGAQVVDLDAFNLDDFRERFSSSETRSIYGGHLKVGDQLLTVPPWQRPILTVTADTVRHEPNQRGAISHDILYGRCSRKLRQLRYGSDTPGCQDNIAAAIADYGLTELDVHDPFNVFMNTGLDDNDQLFFIDPDAKPGDYLEMRAELNCLIAISTCPGRSSGPEPHTVHFEIYEE